MQELSQKNESPLPGLESPQNEARLKLSDGRKIKVRVLGEDRFGLYGQKEYVCPIYSFEALEWLTDRIRNATRHHFDQVILATGKERSGKTTLAFHLALGLDPDFNLDGVAFTQDEFREKVREAKAGSTLVLDEAGPAMFSREWMHTGQRELVKSFMVFGMKELKIILVLPHRSLLDYQLRNRRLAWWLSVYTKGIKERGFARLRKAEESEWRIETWWDPRFTLKYPKFRGGMWNEYEERKAEFIDDQLAGKYATHSTQEQKLRQEVYGIVRNLKKRGLTSREIVEITSRSQQSISRILRREVRK